MVRLRDRLFGLFLVGSILACGLLDAPNPEPTATPLVTAAPTNSAAVPSSTPTLSTHSGVNHHADWTNLPWQIAYHRLLSQKNSVSIFVMTPDRTYQKQLTNGSGVSFQPNGRPMAS